METHEMKDPDPEDILACKLAMSLLDEMGTYEKAREKAKELAETCLKMHHVYTKSLDILDIEENVHKTTFTGN